VYAVSENGISMTPAEKERLAATIRELAAEVIDPDDRKLVAKTGALPVHADIGGTLLLTPDLRVLSCAHGSDQVSEEGRAKWTLLALRLASERFPELAELRPRRPADARECPVCSGSGTLFGRLCCGQCSGLGWCAPRLKPA
jgi:hypothetical protein